MSFLIAGAVTAGVAGATKLGVAISGRGKRIAEQEKANKENERMMAEYKALDTSNPYANMQNTMEDLTVNQQQAQFQAQQAASIQMQERVGDARSQDLEAQKTATLLGMSQQRVAAANQARAQAKAAQMSAIGDIGEVGMQMIKGGGDDDGGVDNTEDNEYQVDPNAPASKKAVSIGKKAKGN